jgi:protein SCO1/2
MKSSLVCLLALLSVVSGRAADASAAPSCCAVEKPAAKPAAAPCCTEIAPAAPYSAKSLYQLDAKWTDDAGRTVGLGLHRGRPVIVAMFFASCEYACPVLVNDIRRLQKSLPEDLRRKAQVILVTFDVARDTPEALRAFRARMNLDDGWTLLRGDTMAVQDLAMLLGVKFKQDARGQFSHSNLFSVLNAEGQIAHQHAGLMGDVSEAAQAVAALIR